MEPGANGGDGAAVSGKSKTSSGPGRTKKKKKERPPGEELGVVSLAPGEQRLRDLYASPCTVDMCPRNSCSINWETVEALPLFEEGMSDKMLLFKVEKSSRLPTAAEPRLDFEAAIEKALPGFAYYLDQEHKIADAIRETDANVRFGVQTLPPPGHFRETRGR